ncbi:hypothetical protein [Bradyrhizobium genosp. SA-3]|uniref:hypothetical protein n=1 Tax=Bradyrhizobium genosp. SA-3 TaxID=508868 RepID=UPI001ABFDDEA|nr:hypothetical protein [Bradyrhizobium genosp. SA-3]
MSDYYQRWRKDTQTVFEGSEANTFDRLRENQRRYGLHVPFGHAVADSASGDAVPTIIPRAQAPDVTQRRTRPVKAQGIDGGALDAFSSAVGSLPSPSSMVHAGLVAIIRDAHACGTHRIVLCGTLQRSLRANALYFARAHAQMGKRNSLHVA